MIGVFLCLYVLNVSFYDVLPYQEKVGSGKSESNKNGD